MARESSCGGAAACEHARETSRARAQVCSLSLRFVSMRFCGARRDSQVRSAARAECNIRARRLPVSAVEFTCLSVSLSFFLSLRLLSVAAAAAAFAGANLGRRFMTNQARAKRTRVAYLSTPLRVADISATTRSNSLSVGRRSSWS